VPLAALEHLKPVPSSYLKQISRDMDLFRQLPVEAGAYTRPLFSST